MKTKSEMKIADRRSGKGEQDGGRGTELGKGCVTRPIVNQYVSAVLDCQSALNINGRLQNSGGKNKVKFVVVSGRRTFCVTKLCKRMSANGRAAERQQNERPPSKDYERKLTLIAENMRQLIDRQMTGHIKCTHTHT